MEASKWKDIFIVGFSANTVNFKLDKRTVSTALKALHIWICLISNLALPKDTIDSGQKVGILSHECGKVYIEETGKCIHERIEAENESGIAFTNSDLSCF